MESPPASLRFQIVQMHARLVANQLATYRQHDCVFGANDVIPRETEDLSPTESQGQS
ncbi:MAG TPA: hypothetical protein VMU68_07965 [Acidimicrobiales bacterium]|nr:hypothetical protein [Acidimicrobiales bacterium]